MNDPQPMSPRQRLQVLLAIPESRRTDAEWDEINELEIMLASGMRQPQPTQNVRHGNAPSQQGNRHGNSPSRGSRSRPHRWSRGGKPRR